MEVETALFLSLASERRCCCKSLLSLRGWTRDEHADADADGRGRGREGDVLVAATAGIAGH